MKFVSLTNTYISDAAVVSVVMILMLLLPPRPEALLDWIVNIRPMSPVTNPPTAMKARRHAGPLYPIPCVVVYWMHADNVYKCTTNTVLRPNEFSTQSR